MIVLIVISIGFPKSRRTITTSRSTWWHWSKSLWKCIELFVKINRIWLFQDYSNGLSFSLRTTKSLNRRSDSEGSRSRNSESTSSNNLTAFLTFPNTNTGSLDSVLTAESTSITTMINTIRKVNLRAVLRDFNLLDNLTKRGTISCSVFTADTDLLSSLTLQ